VVIRKGEDWGINAPLAADGVVVNSDAAVGVLVADCRRAGQPVPPIGLLGGDLWKAFGEPDGGIERLRGPNARTVDCDLGVAQVDGQTRFFVAHAVVRNGWWRGRVVAIMNSEWMGGWRVVPRAHPNDGKLDVVDGNPAFGQRWIARKRLPFGDHLPHPELAVRRASTLELDLVRPAHVWLDGVDVGRAGSVSVQLEPDALTLVF
jgi:hypothetical protein